MYVVCECVSYREFFFLFFFFRPSSIVINEIYTLTFKKKNYLEKKKNQKIPILFFWFISLDCFFDGKEGRLVFTENEN
jgi:hypothetical protein